MAEEELPPEPEVIDADQELMVKEALENSDLFSRYNLTEKAIVELEKVLQFYPDQIEVHRRILEISRKGFPERGAIAAAQLARIFHKRGDADLANKYHSIATAGGTLPDLSLLPPSLSKKVEEPVSSPPPAPAAMESAMPMEFSVSPAAAEEPVAVSETPPGTEFSFDAAPWGAPGIEPPAVPPPPQAPVQQTMELDLSDDLDALTTVDSEAPEVAASEPGAVASPRGEIPVPEEFAIPPEPLALPPFAEMALPSGETLDEVHAEPLPGLEQKDIPAELDDSKIEVEFYLENGFVEEARQTVAKLEEKYPGNSFVAGLRQQLDAHLGKAAPTEAVEAMAAAGKSAVAEIGLHDQPTVEEPPLEISSAELIVAPALEPVTDTLAPPPLAEREPDAIPAATSELESAVAAPAVAATSGADLLGDLAGDLDSSLDGFATSPGFPSAAPGAPPVEAATPPPDSSQGASQLSGLLAEMEDFDAASNRDDPETHYNLGVAFREMGLLDESIGEFQKVVRGAGKGKYPPNFLQACSLLAICFMEKRMPALAVRWYKRALETPDLDEEALMALQYDLGVAYEQAGDSRNALERFTEVYSQNIDFRDVAEKIRELQQKV
jgi:tetratricopeptide (TPR) repeat protein